MKTTIYKYLMAAVLLFSSLCMMAIDDCVCFTSSCRKVPVSSFTLDHTELTILYDKNNSQTLTLESIIGPENAYNQHVTWTVTDDNKDKNATIDENGNITIPKDFKNSTITITATLVDDVSGKTYTKTCTVSVVENIPDAGAIILDVNDICANPGEAINMINEFGIVAYQEKNNKGEYKNLITTPSLYYKLSSGAPATVTDNTLTINSNAPRSSSFTVEIRNKTNTGTLLGTVTVQVTGGAPTSITLDQVTASIYVRKGQNMVQLAAEVTPKCASHDMIWTCSDPTIATVDGTGLVTAIKLDRDTTIMIIATSAEDATIKDTCYVNICRKLPYSVSPNTWVEFSTGNLQYNAQAGTHVTADGAGVTAGTWRFADNQWDVIGDGNANVSETYNGWIDLFGWGTSGWNSGSDTYWHPWDTQGEKDEYAVLCVDGTFASTKPYYDWGAYNEIQEMLHLQEGVQTINHTVDSWRTLTRQEWEYLTGITIDDKGGTSVASSHRANALQLNTMATVEGIPGLILLPDDWDWIVIEGLPSELVWSTGVRDYTTYQFTAAQWALLEAEGATFMPAAGRRQGQGDKTSGSITPVECGVNGFYWSSSDFCKNHANVLNFTSQFIGVQENHGDYCNRCNGYAIRLVRVVDL